MKVTRTGDAIVVTASRTGGAAKIDLMRYVYRPATAAFESPRPYAHPLRTLAGDVVTGFRPRDHRWHHGLSMTAAHVSGDNFWGGPSWVRATRRYEPLDNHGTQRHESFMQLSGGAEGFGVSERLSWISSAGELWAREERRLAIPPVAPGAEAWELRWTTWLTGERAEPLRIGSPATHGRPGAGYGGLTWRGPRDLQFGDVLGPDGRRGEEAMLGQQTPWIAFTGVHDEVDRSSTLIFEVAERGPAVAWHVRSEEYPGISAGWAFHEEFTIERGERIRHSCRIIIATGAWDAARIEAYLASHPW